MPLNNEITMLNIHNIDNDIKDAPTRAMIAPEEKESYATHDYQKNQYFIWKDRKIYKATTAIPHGTTITIGGNVKAVGTLSNEIYNLYVESDDGIRELIGNIEEANASKAYYFGDYIVLASDGLLYQVTTNVSMGTAWRVGTNISHVDNVGAVLTELKKKIHNTQQMLATVEPTNKASKSYNVGDQFIFDDVLVEATAHIEQQATIIRGTNCQPVRDITEQITKLEEGVKTAKSGVLYNDTRKLLIIADSYGTFFHTVTDNFPYKLLEFLNCQGDVVAEGGSGFIGNGTARTFQQMFEATAKSDYTDIVFAGGYNDRNTWYGNSRQACQLAIEKVREEYGDTVNIWVVHTAGCADSDVKYSLLSSLKGYMEACCYSNTYFVDLSSVLLKREFLAMDGVHPGGNGMSALALSLAQAMTKGYYGYNVALTKTGFKDVNGIMHEGLVYNSTNSGIPIMKLNSVGVTLSSPITDIVCEGLPENEIKLGDFHDPVIQGGIFNTVNAPLYVKGKQTSSSGETFWNILGFYYVYDSELRFVPMCLPDGYSSGWLTLYSISWYKIPPLTFMLPTYAQ